MAIKEFGNTSLVRVFSIYVAAAFCGTPHVCGWVRLRFLVAVVWCVCLGVASANSATRTTWLYVEAAMVWLWWHVETAFAFTRINENNDRAIQSGTRMAQKIGNSARTTTTQRA